MIPLYQVEEMAKHQYRRALSATQAMQDYKRSVRKTKARQALERVVTESIHSGANLGELRREIGAVLQRVAE